MGTDIVDVPGGGASGAVGARLQGWVQALQKRWDYLHAGLDLILQQRGANTADLTWGAIELLVRGYKGNKPTGW